MTTPQSPDLVPYTGLTLDDRSAQDFIDLALQDAIAKMPGYTPRAGATEVVLIENLALIVGELVGRLNFTPALIVEYLLDRLFQVYRSPGAPATGSVNVTTVDTQARVLPAGSRLSYTQAGSRFILTTMDDLVIPAGQSAGTVAVQTADLTDQLNGIPAGVQLGIIDSVSWVQTVALLTPLTGGALPEDDGAYLDRGSQTLRRLTSTLVLPVHFEAAALATVGVFRAKAVDSYDPGSGHAPGADPGHISLATLDSNGNVLSTVAKNALLATLQTQASGQLSIHMIDPTTTAVNVTVTVKAMRGADSTQTHDAVVAALQSYMSPTTWTWDAVARVDELITLISNVAGVDYIVSMPTPAADVALSGAAPLATAGVISVTVQ